MNIPETCIKVFLCLFFFIQLAVNLIADYAFISYPAGLYAYSRPGPVKVFIGFKPYLKNIHMAGYWTDFTPKNPDVDLNFISTFYQIQNVLIPTLLDHYQPLGHEYVVVFLKNTGSLANLLKFSKAKVIVRLSPQIILIHRTLS